MLELVKRDNVDRVVLHNVSAKANAAGEGAENGEAGNAGSLRHSLHAARANEHALQQRLHRVRDPKGMDLLRGLRTQISCLEELLGEHGPEEDQIMMPSRGLLPS